MGSRHRNVNQFNIIDELCEKLRKGSNAPLLSSTPAGGVNIAETPVSINGQTSRNQAF